MTIIPAFEEFQDSFRSALRGFPESRVHVLENGATCAMIGQGRRVAVLGGLHGDERSGPLAILKVLQEDGPALIPDGLELWVVPLVNDEGWDRQARDWNGIDLNRIFIKRYAPHFIKSIMAALAERAPEISLDLHEDSRHQGNPYFYSYQPAPQPFVQALAEATGAGLTPWAPSRKWAGTSEVFVRRKGCIITTTAEISHNGYSLEQRIDWYASVLRWSLCNARRFLH
jgi:predicted deacylase